MSHRARPHSNVFEKQSCSVTQAQCNFRPLGSNDSPTSASGVSEQLGLHCRHAPPRPDNFFVFIFSRGSGFTMLTSLVSCLELLTSDPPPTTSQAGVSQGAWPIYSFYLIKEQ